MIKKLIIYLILSSSGTQVFSQKIINIIMVGPGGVTEDPQTATQFTVIKHYPDLHFERLDYKKGGPLIKLISYKDQDLKISDGKYLEYAENGALRVFGKYLNNAKDGIWYKYNDTGKVIKSVKYSNDSIVEIIDPEKKDSVVDYSDEKEASFTGGDKAWVKYLRKKLEKDNPAEQSFHGGTVHINFMVGTDGIIEELFVSKSVEYILDETSLKIIGSSPKWNPAFQNGKYVRAYRRQPLTFIQQ